MWKRFPRKDKPTATHLQSRVKAFKKSLPREIFAKNQSSDILQRSHSDVDFHLFLEANTDRHFLGITENGLRVVFVNIQKRE